MVHMAEQFQRWATAVAGCRSIGSGWEWHASYAGELPSKRLLAPTAIGGAGSGKLAGGRAGDV